MVWRGGRATLSERAVNKCGHIHHILCFFVPAVSEKRALPLTALLSAVVFTFSEQAGMPVLQFPADSISIPICCFYLPLSAKSPYL